MIFNIDNQEYEINIRRGKAVPFIGYKVTIDGLEEVLFPTSTGFA